MRTDRLTERIFGRITSKFRDTKKRDMARPGVYPTLAKWVCSIFVCLALAGCQFLLEVDDTQCEMDQQCVELLGNGFECSDDNVCVRKPDEPEPDAGNEQAGAGAGGA